MQLPRRRPFVAPVRYTPRSRRPLLHDRPASHVTGQWLTLVLVAACALAIGPGVPDTSRAREQSAPPGLSVSPDTVTSNAVTSRLVMPADPGDHAVTGVRPATLEGSAADDPPVAQLTAASTNTVSVRWGLIGDDGTHLDATRSAGITTRLLELNWAAYEPRSGAFDPNYVAWARGRLAGLRAAGFSVILSLGVQYAPSWLLSSVPNAYYVDQFGDRYNDRCSGCERPNFVWNPKLRALQARYIARVFADFGSDFAAVRLGGGHYGELGYPTARYAGHANTYWAFDANAARSNPVPGWKPGRPSPHHEASKFLNWYLNKLVNYERWQIATVRSHYPGRLMMLFPSWGIRPTQAAKAIAGNLRGTTSAEVNGEIQRGYAFARQVAAITDPGVVVTTTWLDASGSRDGGTDQRYWSPVHYLARLAAVNPLHLRTYGENTGRGTRATLHFTVAQAAKYRLLGLAWFNESELFSGSYATLGDYAAEIAAH